MKTEIEEYVIQQVKKIRQEKGFSQTALADSINISRGFMSNIENPKHRAKYNLNLLNEIAKVFECSIRDFFPEKYI